MKNNNTFAKVKDYATKTAIAVTAYIILKDTLKYVFRAIKEYTGLYCHRKAGREKLLSLYHFHTGI